jgi:tetratricopeptide (TPR) repeat protein
MAQLPFVGRRYEQQRYQEALRDDDRWMLMIVGEGGRGKSALLDYLAETTPQTFPVVKLNFADPALRTDTLTMLEHLAWQVKPHCNAQCIQRFERALREGRDELAAHRHMSQTIIASDATVQGIQLTMSASEQYRQVREKVRQALYDLLETLHPVQLVLMLDTCDWFYEPECAEMGQWILNGLLPGIQTRLRQCQRRCIAVIASRIPLRSEAIDQQEQPCLDLHMLERADVDDYLQRIGMQEVALQQRVYDLTHGHPLCLAIIGSLWQEQPFTSAELPAFQERFTEQVLLKFVSERILDKRLKTPFRELTRYGSLLRRFNLPMLQAVFPDLHLEYEQFQQFTRYPYIEKVGNHRHALHDLLREVLANEIREQEPGLWQAYHQRAFTYMAAEAPRLSRSADWYYHAIALRQNEGMSQWWSAIQNAYIRDEREAFSALLQAAQDPTLELTPQNQAWSIQWQGHFYRYSYQMEAALASYEQALALFQQVGDRLGEANCYLAQGRAAQQQKEYQSALALHMKAYQLYQQIQDHYSQARLLYYRSYIYEEIGEHPCALQDIEAALLIAQQFNLPIIDILQGRLEDLQSE